MTLAVRFTDIRCSQAAIATDIPGMLSVNRWTKYGKDRLYVADPVGESIGWLDLQSGATVLERPEWIREFDRAIAKWLLANGMPRPRPGATGFWGRGEQEITLLPPDLGAATSVPSPTELRPLRRRRTPADSEARLVQLLAALPADWTLSSDLALGRRGRLERLLVSPAGVYTVRALHQPGVPVWVSDTVMMIDAIRTDHIRHAFVEAHRASRLLTEACRFTVHADALIIADAQLTVHMAPGDVHVVHQDDLDRWTRRRPVRFDADQLVTLRDRVASETTWLSTSAIPEVFSPFATGAGSAAGSSHAPVRTSREALVR
jgi:hypothetical protein